MDRSLKHELSRRWKAESPPFWKNIMKFAIYAGSSATAILTADQLFGLEAGGVHPIVFVIARYAIVACATLGLSAKITTT